MKAVKNYLKTNLEKIISVSLILAIIVHMTFLSLNSYIDPFLNDQIAYITLNISNPHFSFFEGYLNNLPAFSSFIFMLSQVTGISPSHLRFIPILGPIFILVLYMFGNVIFKRPIYSACITYIMYMSFSGPYYSIWPHGFGFMLFIPFIFVFYRVMDKKKWEYIILALLIFVSLHFYSYTAELWAIPFVIFLNVYIYLTAKDKNKYLTTSIATSFIVILLASNELIYQNLSKLGSNSLFDSIQLFSYKFLHANNQFAEQFVYQSISPKALSSLNLMYIILIASPIAILIMIKLYQFIKIRKIRYVFKKEDAFWFALIVTAIFPIIAYSFMGVILMGYIMFIYPLIAFFFVNKHLKKSYLKYSYLFLLIFLITSIVSWNWAVGTSFGGSIISSNDNFKEFEPSANWFLKNRDDNIFISDHYTGGIFAVIGANNEIPIIKSQDYEYYYPPSYEGLVSSNSSNNALKNNYVVINDKYIDKKVWAGGWGDFQPLYYHTNNINSNKNINKIYNDRITSIFSGGNI